MYILVDIKSNCRKSRFIYSVPLIVFRFLIDRRLSRHVCKILFYLLSRSELNMTDSLQPDQINMAVVVLFWYLVKSDASVRYCTEVYTALDKVRFTMYQKHMAIYNWSPCRQTRTNPP